MRKINKGDPIPGFNGSTFGKRCNNWVDFHKNHKDEYEESRLQILIEEQNQLCGYTEVYINDLTDCHIDHYRKKGMFPQLTFNWNNLIVATKDSSFGANYKDSKYKIKKYEYQNIFNPIEDNVELFFDYTSWGEITPKTSISAI